LADGIYGIDVSGYQAAHYPTTVGGHPVDFAFVKATEATSYVNPNMVAQAAFTRANGDVLGFYHFLHSGNVQAQAEYFVTKAASQEGDVLACDWEMGGVSGADKDAFLKAVKKLRPTHRVGLYCDANHWLNVDKTSYVGDFLWLANYNNKPATSGVQHAVQIHQYTSTPVDSNYASAWGTKAAMRKWAEGLITGSTPSTSTPSTTDEEIDVTQAELEAAFRKILMEKDGVYPAPKDAADYDPTPGSPGNGWSGVTWYRDVDTRIRQMPEKTAEAVWSYKIDNPARPDADGNPAQTPASSFQRSEDSHYDALAARLATLEAKLDQLIAALPAKG
jgi:hypothetical protein